MEEKKITEKDVFAWMLDRAEENTNDKKEEKDHKK